MHIDKLLKLHKKIFEVIHNLMGDVGSESLSSH